MFFSEVTISQEQAAIAIAFIKERVSSSDDTVTTDALFAVLNALDNADIVNIK